MAVSSTSMEKQAKHQKLLLRYGSVHCGNLLSLICGTFGKKTSCCKILAKSTCVSIFQSPINSGTCEIERTNIVIVDLLIK